MFTNHPPEDVNFPLPIVRCRPSQPLDVAIAVREYRGVMTHYLGGRTVVCHDPDRCLGCEANMLPRWQGYAICESSLSKTWAVLQFTPMAATVLDRGSQGYNGILGIQIRLTRLGSRPNSPLHCKITGMKPDVREWSEEQLESIVQRLFSKDHCPSVDTIS